MQWENVISDRGFEGHICPCQAWGALNSWPHIEIQQLPYGTNFD